MDSGKVFINESLWRYCKFLWSKCKKLCTEEWIEACWVSNHQIKLRIEPEEAVLRISHIQDMKNYFQVTIFTLISFLCYQ